MIPLRIFFFSSLSAKAVFVVSALTVRTQYACIVGIKDWITTISLTGTAIRSQAIGTAVVTIHFAAGIADVIVVIRENGTTTIWFQGIGTGFVVVVDLAAGVADVEIVIANASIAHRQPAQIVYRADHLVGIVALNRS